MNVLVIVNPVSGRLGASPSRLAGLTSEAMALLALRGVRAKLRLTEYPGHATLLAAEAAAEGADRVLAWGGDGTINEVACALALTATALAIVPAGSGNGLARELRVPFRPMRAIDAAIAGEPRAIDVGELGGKRFLNVAGIGVDARVARAFDARRRGRHGLRDYVLVSLREIRTYRPSPCTLTIDGEEIRTTPIIVAIANSAQYGNGARIAPQARPDDGELDLVVVEASSPWRDLWRARRLFTGSMARDPRVVVRRGTTVRFDGADGTVAHVDGQPFTLPGHAEANVLPGALRVIVPAAPRP